MYTQKVSIKYGVLFIALMMISLLVVQYSAKTHALSTYVWDNRSTVAVVPLRYAPEGTSLTTKYWMIEGTKFAMNCYKYWSGFTGNYYSTKWFYGQEYSRGSWGWVHSSYVYNQTSVGVCK